MLKHLRSPLSSIPDSCRERMQESTSSKPVVNSSSISFCPSAAEGNRMRDKQTYIYIYRGGREMNEVSLDYNLNPLLSQSVNRTHYDLVMSCGTFWLYAGKESDKWALEVTCLEVKLFKRCSWFDAKHVYTHLGICVQVNRTWVRKTESVNVWGSKTCRITLNTNINRVLGLVRLWKTDVCFSVCVCVIIF